MILKRFLILSLAFFLLGAELFCQDETRTVDRGQQVLNEAFIMITVTSERGNSFYRVLTDTEERPYLNIQDFSSQYLDMSPVKCDLGRKHCQVTLQPKGNVFWIDGKYSEYGDSEQGTAQEKIPEGAFVIQDGACWLRFDVWQKWLPLTATWDRSSYYLSIIPEFKLLAERKRLRDQELELAEATKKQKELIAQSEAIKPVDIFRPELKYHGSLRQYPRQQIGGDFNYDLNVDLFRGTFQTGGPINYDRGPGVDYGRPYWVYRLQDQGWFYLMEVGDTYFEESNMLLPNISAVNGFRFDTRQMIYGSGRISVNGRAQQNTLVDLYRDGLYLDTVRVANDGRYVFDDIVVNSNSRLVAKLYFPDGSEEVRDIVLSDDNGMIIPKGQFQERVFTGDTLYGRMNYAALRYGLFNNFTIGVHPMFFEGSKHATGMADLAMRPLPDTVFLAQGLFTGKNIDRAFRVNTTLLYPNFLEVEHRYYSGGTPSFFKNMRPVGEYWAGRHQLGIGRLQFINAYEQFTGMKDATMELIYTFSRYLKPFFSYGYYFPSTMASYKVIRAGFDIMATDHSVLEISRTWTPPVPINSISFFVRNIINVGGWDIGATWNIPDRLIKSNITADVMYRVTKNFSIGALCSDKYFGFRINVDGVITPSPGPATWSEFSMGTLSGQVMSPNTDGAEPFPIENASILVGNKAPAVTDKEGKFTISGITTYQKLVAKVDPSSIDASMAPEKEYDVVYFRPGTTIMWSPKLLWTAGLDGTIEGIEAIAPDMMVEAVKEPEGRVISTGKVENDGFFIIEKLTPGKYTLRITGLKEGATKTMIVDIPQDTNWLSGIKWDLGWAPVMEKEEPKQEEPSVIRVKEKTKTRSRTRAKVKSTSQTSDARYYAIDEGPLFVTQVMGKTRGLEGILSSNKKIPSSNVFVEVISLKDNKIVGKVEVTRGGSFIVDGLEAGNYELRLIGVNNPPKPMQVEIDQDIDWLSGISWDWEQ